MAKIPLLKQENGKAIVEPIYKSLDDKKQDKLVSGSTIKTINGQSLLGGGNITIEANGGNNNTILFDCSGYLLLYNIDFLSSNAIIAFRFYFTDFPITNLSDFSQALELKGHTSQENMCPCSGSFTDTVDGSIFGMFVENGVFYIYGVYNGEEFKAEVQDGFGVFNYTEIEIGAANSSNTSSLEGYHLIANLIPNGDREFSVDISDCLAVKVLIQVGDQGYAPEEYSFLVKCDASVLINENINIGNENMYSIDLMCLNNRLIASINDGYSIKPTIGNLNSSRTLTFDLQAANSSLEYFVYVWGIKR